MQSFSQNDHFVFLSFYKSYRTYMTYMTYRSYKKKVPLPRQVSD